MNLLLKVFLIFLINVNGNNFYSCPQYEPFCSCDDLNILCDNFTNFNQLNLTDYSCNSISIRASSSHIRLNDNLDLSKLNFTDNFVHLTFSNLNGIDYKSSPFRSNKPDTINLDLIDSFLDIYDDDVLLDSKRCDVNLNSDNLFKSLNELTIKLVNQKSKICPIIFKNAYIDSLSLSTTPNSSFEFYFLSEKELNCTINNLNLDYSEIYLDSTFLNNMIFSQLSKISIKYSNIRKIEKNVFHSFKKLKTLVLLLENFEIIYENGIEWMNGLNNDIYVDLKNETNLINRSNDQFTLFILDTENNYVKNDSIENFCVFRNFPHEKLIFPIFETNADDLPCSCNIIWLIQYREYYVGSYKIDMDSDSVSHCFDKSFQKRFQECNFEKKINDCKLIKNKARKIELLTSLFAGLGAVVFILLFIFGFMSFKYFSIKKKTINKSFNEDLGFSPMEMVIDE